MKIKSLMELAVGDVIEHVVTKQQYVVIAPYGTRVTAVRIADVTNPKEWEIVSSVTVRKTYPNSYPPPR